jgi:hypothetical integral membrane protein (TIGR02206 family)
MQFQLFGTPHLIVLVSSAVLMVLLHRYVRNGKHHANRQRDVWVLTIVFLLIEVALVGSKIVAGEWDIRYNLPLHLCDISAVTILYALHARSERAFQLGWYWGIVGGLMAMLVPNLQTINWYFVPYFVWHLFLIAGPVYQMSTDGFRLPYRSIYTTLGVTILLSTVMFVFNRWLGSNYMFVNEKISSFDALGLPDFPWFLPCILGLAWVLFHGVWWLGSKK